MPDGVQVAIGHDTTTTPAHIYNSALVDVGGVSSITIGAGGRNGTNALIVKCGGSSDFARAAKTLPSPLSTIYYAFPFKTDRLPAPATSIICAELRDAGSAQVRVILSSDGTLGIQRGDGAALIAAVPDFSMSINTFYHFEIGLSIHGSTAFVKFWVNEAEKLNLTNQNTQGVAGSTIITEIVACCANVQSQVSVTTFRFDDIIVRNDQHIGDCHYREILPTGTGSVDDGVPTGAASSREAVDDTAPDGDATKTALENVGDKFLLTYPPIPTDVEVVAVIPTIYAQKSDAGPGTFKVAFKIDGSDYLGAEQSPSAGSYAHFPDPQMVSPDTGIAWTPAEVNALEMGAERTA